MPEEDAERRSRNRALNSPAMLKLRVPQFRIYCRETGMLAGQSFLTGEYGNSLRRVQSFFLNLFADDGMSSLRLLLEEEGNCVFQECYSAGMSEFGIDTTVPQEIPTTLDAAAYGFIREEYRKRSGGYSDAEIGRFMGAEPREMPAKLALFARNYPRRFQK